MIREATVWTRGPLIGGFRLAAVLVELGGHELQLGLETVVVSAQLRDAAVLLTHVRLQRGDLVTSLLILASLVLQSATTAATSSLTRTSSGEAKEYNGIYTPSIVKIGLNRCRIRC